MTSAKEELHIGRALGGVPEMVAGQMAPDNPDAPHLHHCVIHSGSKFRKKIIELNDKKIRNENENGMRMRNWLSRKLTGKSKSDKQAYIHKGEAENNKALVREPGGNREKQADDKYRRRNRVNSEITADITSNFLFED